MWESGYVWERQRGRVARCGRVAREWLGTGESAREGECGKMWKSKQRRVVRCVRGREGEWPGVRGREGE